MRNVTFERYRIHEGALWLEGPQSRARIEAYAGGYWRMLVWHRPRDAEKGSWVVERPDARPLRVEEQGGALQLLADEARLELRLDPFALVWDGLTFTDLQVGELPTWTTDAAAVAEAVAGAGALREVEDGHALGGGYALHLREREGRRYFGLGERTGFLDKKGRRWLNWTADAFEQQPQDDPLYQAHPFVIAFDGGRTRGIYLDESWKSLFDLAAREPGRSRIAVEGPTFDLWLVPGPEPAAVLKRFTALVGRPWLPPLWALGYHQCRWSYPDEAAVREVLAGFREHDLPLSALWLDIDHMDGYKVFTFSPHRFPDPPRLVRELAEQGVRVVTIVDPAVKKEPGYSVYESGRKIDAFVKNRREEELVGEVWPKPAVWPDFSRPEVRRWWGEQHRPFVEAGVAGIWNDMNEPAAFAVEGDEVFGIGKTLPSDARHGDRLHAEVHNLYGLLMSRATHEGLVHLREGRRPFVLTRSGFSGIQRYAWVWTGDNGSHWEHMAMSVPMLLNLGLSGVAFCGADIGGFRYDADGELLARWTWLGAFYPFMRNHSAKTSRRQEPWAFGEPWLSHVRAAIRFRYRLMPYLYTLAEEAARTGQPLMRPLFYHFPDDPGSAAVDDQFLLGSELLVAPVLRPGADRRLVYLPPGYWRDFWTGAEQAGPDWIVSAAPHGRIPLWQRAQSALPLTGPRPPSEAHWDPLIWRVAPGERVEGTVYLDDGEGSGPGLRVRLGGRYDGARLLVTQEPATDGRAWLELVGVDAPKRTSAPAEFADGRLRVELLAGEAWVEW
ncbi:MAG TPA: alpha-glucosidase [Oceanithermus profundus]|uniref:Alpha-glucosidase n=1 Tax=Oceanithermus profundus TaxID=187137 RepID=A0A7C4VH39_9DEIN|nr:alpha-glucosidase [Oceanithermus profundus]